uniref:Chromosome 2 open reading frame 78 n=1 Tax=Catagonus wagneri TaxID=51154 RepID=A0A8C3WWX4_9CETA
LTENFQNTPVLGTLNSLQLSLPVVSNAASLTGSICNLSGVSAPAASSAWLLPSASGTSAQPLLVMENSLGLQPPSQTFCLSQTPEFPKSCSSRNIRILESNPPPELGNISTIAQGQSSSNLLGLPPGPSQEQIENKSLDDVKTKQPSFLDAYQIPIENLDPPLLPLKIPDIHHLLACIDPPGHEEQPGSEKSVLGNNSLSLEDLGTLENGTEFNGGFADIATLVDDMHLPQLFNSLEDLDQSKGPKEKSSVLKAPSDQPRQNKHKASEPIDGAPKPKIQVKNPECLLGGEVVICNAVISDKGLEHTAEPSHGKPQKAASKRIRKTRSHGQEKTKRTRENNSKKAEKSKQSESKVKAEEKPTVPRMKRKKNQPDLSQENFKKPLSSLGMHMLESVDRKIDI